MNELAKGKTMTVKEVADALEVEESTIRRSIKDLESQSAEVPFGKIQGEHGGKPAYALNEVAVTAIKLNLKKPLQAQPKTELEKKLLIQQAWQFLQEDVAKLQKENEILAVENKRLGYDNDRLKTIADEHGDHWSVCEYHQRNNLKYDNKAAIAMGKTLAAISRRNGLPIYKVKAYDTTGRFGDVNAYTREAWELYEAACILV
jgi:DNA-directed RNA polymerase specialized sigma54-like protein